MHVTEFYEKVLPYMRAYRMLPWMIGDGVLQFVESKGEEAWQYIDEAIDAGEISREVLKDYVYLAERYPPDEAGKKYRLSYEISIWKFRDVAGLPVDQALALLRKARKLGWDTRTLRAKVKEKRQAAAV